MNGPLPRKRYWPIVVSGVVAFAALTACLLFAGYLYLPKLVTDRLPVERIQRLGFSDFSGRISKIGLFRTTAGPFVFGRAGRPALTIHSIELDYTPAELRQKKIRRIRISDIVINATVGPKGVSLPGLDLGDLAKESRTGGPAAGIFPAAAVGLEKLEVRSGMIHLAKGSSTCRIPFEADLIPAGPGVAKFDAHLRLFPRDQHLTVDARVDVENRNVRVRFDGPAVTLDGFADLIHLVPGLDATGTAGVRAGVLLKWSPFAAADAKVELALRGGRVACAPVSMEPGRSGAPALLSAVSGDMKTWQVRAGGLTLRTPAPVAVNTLTADVDLAGGMRSVTGRAELTVLPGSMERPGPVVLKQGASVPVRFDFTQKSSGYWRAGIGTAETNRRTRSGALDLTVAGVRLHAGPPRFTLTAGGDGQKGAGRWRLELDAARISGAGAAASLPSVHAKGKVQFRFEADGPAWTGDARIRFPGPSLDGPAVAGMLGALTISARFHGTGAGSKGVDGRAGFTNGRFHLKESGLDLSGCRMDLPFGSGTGPTDRNGSFSVARLVHKDRPLGTIRGRVTRMKNTHALTATHTSDLFPGMTAAFTGTVAADGSRFPKADLTFQMGPYALPAESDMGRLIPAAKGVTLSGTVSARGRAFVSSTGIGGHADVVMKDGALRMTERKISVEGIDGALRFPELPRIRSAPAQRIRFARAAMGGLVVDGGAFEAQVESNKTLFVEKGRLSWCGGTVDTQSLRITAGRRDYDVSLYCQRLGLSRILEQLGSVNARGTGTVNGRIPIVYSNGNLRFDDGFLFSTPGEGGRMQLTGTDILTRGVPEGTPQFAQVELAREALKDYSYTWAKLGLASEGEDFVMRLQFDGKPANPLPFVYKKEIGGFVRVEEGGRGSVFQGIGLDVNLRLPLNQLLQYKDIVNMIE